MERVILLSWCTLVTYYCTSITDQTDVRVQFFCCILVSFALLFSQQRTPTSSATNSAKLAYGTEYVELGFTCINNRQRIKCPDKNLKADKLHRDDDRKHNTESAKLLSNEEV